MLPVLPGLEFGDRDPVINYFPIKGLVFPDSARIADPALIVRGQRGSLFMAAKFMFLMDGTFDALEWLAAMCSHVPNRGEQMVRYYGHYSNVWRGNRQQENQDNEIPCIIEPDDISPTRRKAWARLIQKIYEVDPLTCPKCTGQ